MYKEYNHSQELILNTISQCLIQPCFNRTSVQPRMLKKKKGKQLKWRTTHFLSLKKYCLHFASCSQTVFLKIRTKSIDKNETLKGNYISWQYKYSGMNKVSQTSCLGRALLKTVKIWPPSESPISFIQNQIHFFIFYFRWYFDVLLMVNMYIPNASSLWGSMASLWHLVVGVVRIVVWPTTPSPPRGIAPVTGRAPSDVTPTRSRSHGMRWWYSTPEATTHIHISGSSSGIVHAIVVSASAQGSQCSSGDG